MWSGQVLLSEHGQHEPQLGATAVTETLKVAVKGIRLVQEG